MYLLYVDESGNPKGTQDEYSVLAGVALHEEDAYPFARSVEALTPRTLRGLELSCISHLVSAP